MTLLLKKLDAALQFSKKNRWTRLLTRPYEVAVLKYHTKFRSYKKYKAKTFWGGNMNIVLPEVVSSHIWANGFFDKEVCHYLIASLSPGKVFMDIGAHFGYFSLLASYLVGENGKVISVDPTPSTFAMLSENLSSYSPYKNFTLFNNAAFEEDVELKFHDFGITKSAYNSLFGSRLEDLSEGELKNYEITVHALKVDGIVKSLGLDKVDLIKIDAESAEVNVIKGLVKTMEELKPRIILEIGDTGTLNVATSKDLISFMRSLNYLPYELNNGNIVKHELKDDYSFEKLTCYNILFVHADRTAEL